MVYQRRVRPSFSLVLNLPKNVRQICLFHFLDCDSFIENGGTNTTLTHCDMTCTGDAAEACGGPNRLNLFFSGGSPPPQPIVVPSVGLWESLGCYTCVFFLFLLEMLLEILCKKLGMMLTIGHSQPV